MQIGRAVVDIVEQRAIAGKLGDRPEAAKEGAGHSVDVDIAGMRVRWAESDAPGHAAEVRGVARCGPVRGRNQLSVCGWQDHGTIAVLFFNNRTPAEADPSDARRRGDRLRRRL